VVIKIPYHKWEVGMSCVCPCAELKEVKKLSYGRLLDIRIGGLEFKGRVEGGKLGLRIWRIV